MLCVCVCALIWTDFHKTGYESCAIIGDQHRTQISYHQYKQYGESANK
jgi:hypothetical protein